MRPGSAALCLLLLAASCRPSPPEDPRTALPLPPTPLPPVTASPTAPTTPLAPPAPDVCTVPVTQLDGVQHDQATATLGDVAPTTQLVTVVVPVLDAPD